MPEFNKSNLKTTEYEQKVCVHARMQNRTALGVMHAYLKLNPSSNIEDLQKAFPNELNPDSGVKEIFVSSDQKGSNPNWNGYFFEDDSYLNLADGIKVAVVSMWTKPSLERLKHHAEQYGITTFKEENKDFGGNSAKFRLEYLNGFIPKQTLSDQKEIEPKKKNKTIYIIAAIIAAGIIICCLALA